MTSDERKQMNSLCTRIQEEKDQQRFEALLQEINELMGRKRLRFPHREGIPVWPRMRPWRTVLGTARKLIGNVDPKQGERVEISVSEADDLFREIRIKNTFSEIDGHPVALRQGARVSITFEADSKDTVPMATKWL